MWSVPSTESLTVCALGEELVAYNHLSGDTHLLAPAAGHIVLSLLQAPADTHSLVKSLASLWQLDSHQELTLHTERILAELEQLALIERTSA